MADRSQLLEEAAALLRENLLIIQEQNKNDDGVFSDFLLRTEIIIEQISSVSSDSSGQETSSKTQQLNELLVAEVCRRKLLEEELARERSERDEYLADIIAQVEKEAKQNYHILRKKKSHVEDKLSIASEQRLVLIREVKSLSAELDEVYASNDHLLEMNNRLEDTIKQLQLFILRQYKDSNPLSFISIEKFPEIITTNVSSSEQSASEITVIPSEDAVDSKPIEELSDQIPPDTEPLLLLSADISHDLGDLQKYSFPSSLLELFEETHRTLESSSDLRLNVRDSHISDSGHRHGNLDDLSKMVNDNENEIEPKFEGKSVSNLLGKMLNIHPTALLEGLKANATFHTSQNANNTPNSEPQSSLPSASEVTRRLRSASLTLSHASGGLISSWMKSYHASEEAPATSSESLMVGNSIEQIQTDLTTSDPPTNFICLKCHGTVEGPKYSTCKCDIPSVQPIDLPGSSDESKSHHLLSGLAIKGLVETKNMFSAAVNLFHRKEKHIISVDNPAANPETHMEKEEIKLEDIPLSSAFDQIETSPLSIDQSDENDPKNEVPPTLQE